MSLRKLNNIIVWEKLPSFVIVTIILGAASVNIGKFIVFPKRNCSICPITVQHTRIHYKYKITHIFLFNSKGHYYQNLVVTFVSFTERVRS
jgi:hypothetical protein